MIREQLEVDVLVVGGGPAGLSAALRLAQLQKSAGGEPLSIAVLEKAREAGAHLLSGAVLDPSALRELVPDFVQRGAPLESEVVEDHVYLLAGARRIPLPVTPPPLRNHGNYIVSVNRLGRWLAGLVEAEGVDLFFGFAGTEVLLDGARVIGVRTGDRGIGREGTPRSTYEPGVDVRAKVTIFADGVRGNLTKQLLRRLPLAQGREPEQYAIGIKELWEVPRDRVRPGTVVHTFGYPLRAEEFGGGFIYAMHNGRLSVGLVAGLDYKDPLFDPHIAFQRFKQHPLVSTMLRGGQMVRYGAKALPEGGWNTIPRPYLDGALIVGDAAGFMNSFRLKGIHLAMTTGMLAAETAFEAIRADDWSAARLSAYWRRIEEGRVRAELYPVRNVHQAFGHGLLPGLAFAAWTVVTRGRWPRRLAGHAAQDRMETIPEYYGEGEVTWDASAGMYVGPKAASASQEMKPDRVLTFDRLTNVHFSGTRHEEDQPAHLLVQTEVCHTICGAEYGHPCTRFCPARVYEIVPDEQGVHRLHINASNCVHCKTCDIADPYQVITWVPPEGGGGPQYDGM